MNNNINSFFFYFLSSFSSKLRKKELENLQRDVNQLKTRLSKSPSHWQLFIVALYYVSRTVDKSRRRPPQFHLFILFDRATRGGCDAAAGGGQRDEETMRPQLQGEASPFHKGHLPRRDLELVWPLTLCLLFRLWRNWHRVTETTVQIWHKLCRSIHTHRKRFAWSGASVRRFPCLGLTKLCFLFLCIQSIPYLLCTYIAHYKYIY